MLTAKNVVAVGAIVLSASAANATAYFEIPAGTVTQIQTDFLAAGLVILGLAALMLGYRLIRRVMGR